jgi:arylsulfatase A-like enzyme
MEPADDVSTSMVPWTGPLPERIDVDDDDTAVRLQRTFAAAVTYFDHAVGEFVEQVRSHRLLDQLTFMVTAGHGFPTGEHEFVGDRMDHLHEELVHVPLIIRLPGTQHSGYRSALFSQTLDLLPTLFSWFNLRPPDTDGICLISKTGHELIRGRAFACSGWTHAKRIYWALRTSDYAYLESESEHKTVPLLFAKPDDRWEVNDIAQHFPEKVDELAATLRRFVSETNGHR